MNRLESSISSNENTEENTESSESMIRDTDMAKEIAQYTRLGIIEDAEKSIFAQALRLNRDAIMSLLAG